jgi:hypothetical protein
MDQEIKGEAKKERNKEIKQNNKTKNLKSTT